MQLIILTDSPSPEPKPTRATDIVNKFIIYTCTSLYDDQPEQVIAHSDAAPCIPLVTSAERLSDNLITWCVPG